MAGHVRYQRPTRWVSYDPLRIFDSLIEAKAAVLALTTTPFQRSWVERLQEVQLKMEVAGTSRIEGAEFTERELDVAMRVTDTAEDTLSRSQRQASAAVRTYRWIAALPLDRPIDESLILQIHRLIVTDCDDDHCRPGALRSRDFNVTFGIPVHRGCEGGDACRDAFGAFVAAMQHEFRGYDPLIQALAAHYHLASMHPFEDGNGRTARALEALLLQRSGLRDSAFIAMSNYYYENKPQYLASLAAVAAADHDLTAFLNFGLTGIAQQCRRLFAEIRREMQKALVRNTALDLFGKLWTRRMRVIGERQMQLLNLMLEVEDIHWHELWRRAEPIYDRMRSGQKAFMRDLNVLLNLHALGLEMRNDRTYIRARLEWATEITESEFFKTLEKLPAKTFRFS